MLADEPAHHRLGVRRIVHLVVAMPAEADEIDDDVFAKRLPIAGGELADDAVRVELGAMIDGLIGLIEREADATRPEVLGSILLAAPDATAAEEMARQAAERGYRAMSCTAVADAERILSNRSIAAVVIDGGLDQADGAAVTEAASERHPQAPVIVASDRVGLGEILDDTFGYQPADR